MSNLQYNARIDSATAHGQHSTSETDLSRQGDDLRAVIRLGGSSTITCCTELALQMHNARRSGAGLGTRPLDTTLSLVGLQDPTP